MIHVEVINNVLLQSRTYLMWKEAEPDAYLVDCGDMAPIQHFLSTRGKFLRGIFLTHCHYDHIYGLNEVYQLYPDITVYTSPEGRESLYDEKWNFSKYHRTPFKYVGSNVAELQEGDKIECWPDVIMRAFKTPGHDWSCLSYIVGNMLFTGDSYIPGSKTVTIFPKSNKTAAENSLSKIRNIPNAEIIYPGHGMPVLICTSDLFAK